MREEGCFKLARRWRFTRGLSIFFVLAIHRGRKGKIFAFRLGGLRFNEFKDIAAGNGLSAGNQSWHVIEGSLISTPSSAGTKVQVMRSPGESSEFPMTVEASIEAVIIGRATYLRRLHTEYLVARLPAAWQRRSRGTPAGVRRVMSRNPIGDDRRSPAGIHCDF